MGTTVMHLDSLHYLIMRRTSKSFLSPVLSDSQKQFTTRPFSPLVEKQHLKPFHRQVNDPLTDNILKVSDTKRNDPDLQEYLKTLSLKSSVIKKVEINNLSDISDEDSDILNTKMTLPTSRFLKKSEAKNIEKNKTISPSLLISNHVIEHSSPEVKTRQSYFNSQVGESSEESLSFLLNEELKSEEIQLAKKTFLKKPSEVDTFGKLRKNDSEMLKSDNHLQTPSVQYNKTSAALNKVALLSEKYLKKTAKPSSLQDAKEDHISSENESKTQSLRTFESESSRDLNFEKELLKELAKVDARKTSTPLINKLGIVTIKKDSETNIPNVTLISRKPEEKKQAESEEEMVIEVTFEAQSDDSDSINNLLDLDQLELAAEIDENVNLYSNSTEPHSEDLQHVDNLSKEPSQIKTEKSVSNESDLDDYSEEFEEANEFREISEDSRNAEDIPSSNGSRTGEFMPSFTMNEEVESRPSISEEKVESFKSQTDNDGSLSIMNQEIEKSVTSSVQKEVESVPLFTQKDVEDSYPLEDYKAVESLPSQYHKDIKSLSSQDHKDIESLSSQDHKDIKSLPSQDHKDIESLSSQNHKDIKSLPSQDHKDIKSLSSQDHKDNESLPSQSDKGELFSVSGLKYKNITMESSISHKSSLSSQIISSPEGSLDSSRVGRKVSKKRNFGRYLKRKAAEIKKVDAAVQATASFYVPEVIYFSTPKPIAVNLEAWTSSNPEMLALTELLSQQLELTKNFIGCQESLYQTWSGNLNSDYHYTTLRETKEIIRQHRKEGKKTSRKSKMILL